LSEKLAHTEGIVVARAVKGVPGIVIHLLELFGRHILRLEDDPISGIVGQIVAQNPSFLLKLGPDRGVGIGREDGKLCDIKIDLQEKINEALDVVLILIVGAEDDGPLYADPVVLEPLNAISDDIGGVENGLVDVPASCLCSQLQDFVVVQDRVGDEFFLQRGHSGKEIDEPIPVLSQGIVHQKEAIIGNARHLFNNPVDGTGPEDPSAEKTGAAGKTVEFAAP
jgi:hypothetical protein